jgi:hypothetical protein
MRYGSNPLIDIRHLLFDVVIFFVFIFFASKEFKSYLNNGFLHFWQGMSIGFITYIGAALVFGIFLALLFNLDASIFSKYQEDAKAFLEIQKPLIVERMSEEEFEKQLKGIYEISSNDLIFSTIGKKILAGFFITPVVSIILRKKPD